MNVSMLMMSGDGFTEEAAERARCLCHCVTKAETESGRRMGERNPLCMEEPELIAGKPVDRKRFSYDRQGGIIGKVSRIACSLRSRHRQAEVTETGSVQENRYDAEGLRFELL